MFFYYAANLNSVVDLATSNESSASICFQNMGALQLPVQVVFSNGDPDSLVRRLGTPEMQ